MLCNTNFFHIPRPVSELRDVRLQPTPEGFPGSKYTQSISSLQNTNRHASIFATSKFRKPDGEDFVALPEYIAEGVAKGKSVMNDMIVRKGTTQRFDFHGEPVTWTSYKIEKDDISRSYASCTHPIFKRYFGASDTLVANLVNLSQMLEDGSEDKKFFSQLLNSYIIE